MKVCCRVYLMINPKVFDWPFDIIVVVYKVKELFGRILWRLCGF